MSETSSYNPADIEPKWQKKWEESKVYEVDFAKAKDPYFTHVMFPYPSGDKLHVGHWYNFAPADSFARYQRMLGKEVFSPMGFDAFGLPAENYAIKTGVHPTQSIKENVQTMIKQLKRIGCMYDWNRMVNTSLPEYYKWTQWIFLQIFKNDLAYKKEATVNFCDGCQTVLANEQVWEGKCERCDSDIIQKPLNQWYWKTTAYSQQLLDNLDQLDWPEKTKIMQRNWIGRSEGVRLVQKIKDLDIPVESYDSVPQTYMAQTFAVIAPEHPLVRTLVEGTEHEKPVLEFVEEIKKKKATKKFNIDEDIEGIFTGRYIDNPFGTGDLPIWVCSFVVMDYGTGMVNCSAHDERDFAFAKKYDIPLRPVMFPDDPDEAEKVRNLEYSYCKVADGILEQPEEFKGRGWAEVREDIIEYMVKKGIAKRAVQYRLRDWCISRQRYWGAPIPIVYDPDGNPHPIPEEHLPWTLPEDVEFVPTGEAPLAQSEELKRRTEEIFGEGWTPEVDTMDTFVCSSFYSLMFLGADWSSGEYAQADVTKGQIADKKIEKKWMPVDMYIGGAEHACMHLIYARFVSMVLKDLGHIDHDEQYQRLVHQGVITNQGAKMSKSKGNVVSPDEFVETYGSDIFRMYLMFMGPFTHGGDWSDTGIKGVYRFVQKIWRVFADRLGQVDQDSNDVTTKLHATIKKVGEDIERLHFNTALSALMELFNLLEKSEGITQETGRTCAKLIAPLAPHLAEEMWELTGESGFVIEQEWPSYDESLLVSDTVTIVVQVNGKVRAELEVASDISQEDVIALGKEHENVQKYVGDRDIKKEIYVPGKLVSLVV